jgi:hypothetical protein
VSAADWAAVRGEGISAVFMGIIVSTNVLQQRGVPSLGGSFWVVDTRTGERVYKPKWHGPVGQTTDGNENVFL